MKSNARNAKQLMHEPQNKVLLSNVKVIRGPKLTRRHTRMDLHRRVAIGSD